MRVMKYVVCQKHMWGKCCLFTHCLVLLPPIITLDNGIRFWDEAVENEITMKDNNNDTSWISRWEVNITICGIKSLVTNSTRQKQLAVGVWIIRLIRKGRKAKKIYREFKELPDDRVAEYESLAAVTKLRDVTTKLDLVKTARQELAL